MKRFILFILPFFFYAATTAQNVGINGTGATPDASAILDVQSSNKGLLIPRVALISLTDVLTIPAPATSLLVYNTSAFVTGGVGFYFNGGTAVSAQWTKLSSGTEQLWRELTNYVELIPAKSLYLANSVGIGISSPSEKLQVANGDMKIGNALWTAGNDRMLKFGDDNYVRLGEAGEDDAMQFYAKNFWFRASGSYTGNVGIGTAAAPSEKLEVNGSFKLTNGTQGAGKVLTSNASGVATWTNPPGSVAFRALSPGYQNLATNTSVQLLTPLEDFDLSLNNNGSAFTTPVAGIYHFDAKADISLSAAANINYTFLYLAIYVNGVKADEYTHRVLVNNLSIDQTLSLSTNLDLAAGSVVTLRYLGGATTPSDAQAHNVIFSGFKVY